MTPQQQGRFCDSCQKCVVDFTGFTDEQLLGFFTTHRNEHVCGRFKSWQLNREVSLPPKPHNRFYKWFISLGFMIFLSDLFGTTIAAQERVTTELSSVKKKSKNSGTLLGTVTTGEPISARGAFVIIYQNGIETNRTITDIDGNYVAKKIVAGTYIVHVVLEGYKKHIMTDVLIKPKHVTKLNAVLTQQTNKSDSVDVSQYSAPPVERYGGTSVTIGGANIEEKTVYIIDGVEVPDTSNKIQIADYPRNPIPVPPNGTPANFSNKEGEK